MSDLKRRTFIQGLGAAISLGPAALTSAAAQGAANLNLTRINPQFMVTAKDAQVWHVAKDSQGGPTMAGSPSWKNFLELVERELRARGVVDVFHNKWNYQRWFTSEYPDDSKWSLHIDGQKIRVPSYGAYSGTTPDAGISRELVVYKQGIAAETLRGKIVVIPPGATPPADGPPDPFTAGGRDLAAGDYEYLSDADTFPNPLIPRATAIKATPFGKMWVQAYIRHLQNAGAEGMLFTIPISYEAAAGTYNFVVPSLYALPTLFLDYDSAAQVVEAANAGKQATLRLVAQQENAETYQLFGFLPGKNYQTPSDEQILLITHTDGPSISQENGPLGILGMVHYLSKIPAAERPRTIMIFLDCRHYMPGTERAFTEQDYATKHPDVFRSVVAAMGIEHLGQIEYLDEPDQPFRPSGLAELSTVWITQNQRLVDLAVKSVKDNGLRRVQVQCPGRPGLHGKEQGPWYGLGAIARRLRVPGAATMGSMTAYWSTKARISSFDADHFVTQVATMSQIAGELMSANISELQT
ncbi:MAG: hypothetical protein K2Y37_04635 [Pirellulales bacterium]|nr:hypothetical protein [Pirellulales bacterium]